MRYIAIMDCNNFFVSCERVFRPDLLNRPVMVLSGNDGCVVARSKEVKDMGVPMGIPVFQIKDIIKDKGITTFSSNFTLYRDISARVMCVLSGLVDQLEQYSIDEAFFEIEAADDRVLASRLRSIKTSVERAVGVPVSIAAGATKTQAKYANTLAKKGDGIMVCHQDWWSKEAKNVMLRDIWGVGRNLTAAYDKLGLFTAADLLGLPRPAVESNFGVVGLRLQAELSGDSVYRVGSSAALPKSIMSTRSFRNAVTKKSVLRQALTEHVHHVALELRAKKLKAGLVTMMIRTSRFSDFAGRIGSFTVVLPSPTNVTTVILKAVYERLDQVFDPELPYKKSGLTASQLVSESVTQAPLWTEAKDSLADRFREIDQIADRLAATWGAGAIRLAVPSDQRWSAVRRDFLSPNYTTKWTDIPSVKA